MMVNEFSVAIFGSKTRKNADKYSDKDLLIVTVNSEKFDYDLLKDYTSDKEYSISYYNYDKLKYLADGGSLFVQHLKMESKILIDKNGRLRKIFDDYVPKDDYIQDLKESLNYFDFLKHIPNSSKGKGWFLDCVYVGLRNTLIFKYANEKNYIFSYVEMVCQLEENGYINDKEKESLIQLRVNKQRYREGTLFDLDIKEIKELCEILLKINVYLKPDIVNESKFIEIYRKEIFKEGLNPYQKLRLLEGIYISKGKKIGLIENIVRNPQFYTTKLKDNKFVEKQLRLLGIRHTTPTT